jgi:hypothetical protein
MPLDGLRAWIGEVERKLGMRTRVFLVLATLAIGAAGAAIYLAIDTRDNAVSESDVQELQSQLEGRSAPGSADTAQLEAELKALKAAVASLSGEGGADSGSTPNGDGGSGASSGTSSGEGSDASRAKLKELLEQTKKQNEAAEESQQTDQAGP